MRIMSGLCVALLLCACGVQGGDFAAPVGSMPMITSAPAAQGTATLSWIPPTLNEDGSPLVDLAGYRIYYGTNSNSLDKTVTVNDPNLTRYVVASLPAGTWTFGVTAFSATGTESSLSALASKTIR